MARDYTRHQRKTIKRYYENRDTIALQKLGEVVSEIYLAEGMKRKRLWDRVVRHLQALGVKESTWRPIVDGDKPARLAQLITELQGSE